MKTLYLDLSMGAAGDMLTAALIELFDNPDEIIKELNNLNIPSVEFIKESIEKCGIIGTHIRVKINGEEETGENFHFHSHTHRSLQDIEHIIKEHINVSDEIKKDVIAIYNIIAQSESKAHGKEVSEIHFHEVGAFDAIADITAVSFLIRKINPDKIIVSPVCVGSGEVKCAHGILPVPAPATANILKDVPIYSGNMKGELCTPTGAALVKYFADEFSEMPLMIPDKIGYGMGTKDFEKANCVRAILGAADDKKDSVIELKCNIDDMTGEAIGFAVDELFSQGALDVFTTPVSMKKSRPGVLLTVICKQEDRDRFVKAIFKYTTTLGIRENVCNRYVLNRKTETVQTKYGEIRKKISDGYGVTREKFEYDDLSQIAKRENKSIEQIIRNL
jgi:pyridinium-3,5-bisthiocarboxylic acid mononucleotide nickel chelatase